jgi:ketosteroid isomerase-like protein
MSQDSEDTGAPVRRVWTAFSTRDWAAFAEELDPEVEYRPAEEHTVQRGPEGCTEYSHQWLDAWDTFSAQVEETESAPTPNRVFARIHLRGRGRGSGVEVEERLYWVAELRRGRLYRINEYNDRGEALEAAGLSK